MEFVKPSSCDGQKLWPRLLNICLFNTLLCRRQLLLLPIVAFTQWCRCNNEMFEMPTVTPGCCEHRLVCVQAHKTLINTEWSCQQVVHLCVEEHGYALGGFHSVPPWQYTELSHTWAVNNKLTHLFYHLFWHLQGRKVTSCKRFQSNHIMMLGDTKKKNLKNSLPVLEDKCCSSFNLLMFITQSMEDTGMNDRPWQNWSLSI